MKEKTRTALKITSKMWVIYAMVFLTLWMDQKYFNLLEAKALAYEYFVVVFLAVSVLLIIMGLYEGSIREQWKEFLTGFSILDHSIFFFGAVGVISTLTSEHMEAAIFGGYGWRVGSFYLVTLSISYFVLSRNLEIDNYLLMGVVIVTGLEFLLISFNGFYMDPFSLHEGLSEKDYVRYVGTVGNTNWYVGYVTMILPFILFAASMLEKRWKVFLARTLLILATITLITTNTQGIYLGLFAIGLFYVSFMMKKKEYLVKTVENGILLFLTLFGLLGVEKIGTMTKIDGIHAVVMTPQFLGAGLLLLIFFRVFLQSIPEEKYNRIKKWLIIGYGMIMVVSALGILGSQIGQFNDKWGHNRGKIWCVALDIFVKENWLHKLFGIGANCFGYGYLEVTGSDWVRNAHNEFLEYLVTMGITGLLAYVGIYAGVLAALMKKIKEKTDMILEDWISLAAMVAVMGYGAQAVVNNPQALNGMILVLMLAICRRKNKKVLQ